MSAKSVKDVASNVVKDIVSIDEGKIQSHVNGVVRATVEETLNGLLDAEADRLCGASRYEWSEARKDTRAGHYERKLQTQAGEVELKVPKLRTLTFETAIIERYRRRESSVEEALMEDVPGGCVGEACGGHHSGIMGHAGESGDGERVEQEDIREDRAVAQAPPFPGSIRMCTWTASA